MHDAKNNTMHGMYHSAQRAFTTVCVPKSAPRHGHRHHGRTVSGQSLSAGARSVHHPRSQARQWRWRGRLRSRCSLALRCVPPPQCGDHAQCVMHCSGTRREAHAGTTWAAAPRMLTLQAMHTCHRRRQRTRHRCSLTSPVWIDHLAVD